MTTEGRRLLSILAILPGGIADADLPALLDDGDTAAGVLRACGLAFAEAGRLRMLAPLRAYVAKAYEVAGTDELRVIAQYLALAVRGDELGRATGAEAAERLTPEIGNLETILMRAVNRVNVNELTNATVGYGEFARFTGLGSLQVVAHITASAQLANDDAQRARCLREIGLMEMDRSRDKAAGNYFVAALEIYRTIGDQQGEAYCIRDLGLAALDLSELSEAESRFKEAIPLFRNLNSSYGEADCIELLGEIARVQDDLQKARDRFSEALTLSKSSENLLCEARCARGLGHVALAESNFAIARTHFEVALALYRNIGDVLGQGNAMLGVSRSLSTEDPNTAITAAYAALELYERALSPHGMASANLWLAELASNDAQIRAHRTAARNAWSSIGRDDLIEKHQL